MNGIPASEFEFFNLYHKLVKNKCVTYVSQGQLRVVPPLLALDDLDLVQNTFRLCNAPLFNLPPHASMQIRHLRSDCWTSVYVYIHLDQTGQVKGYINSDCTFEGG